MKLLFLALSLISFNVFAQDLYLQDYNYTVTDIARRGITKEQIFQGLNRTFIKLNSSICSNRALIWAYDMQRQYRINTAKIFLFYTEKTGEASDKEWWYHVSPLVNENGQLWTVDGGFPGFVKSPLTIPQWFQKFVGGTNCYEIKDTDTDLISHMYTQTQMPTYTPRGGYDCYYRIVSAPYWTPGIVAQNMTGRDRNGNPVDIRREQILSGELMQACAEATTSAIGGFFGGGNKKKCAEYFGFAMPDSQFE